HARVERKTFAHTPDRADEERVNTRTVARALGEDLRHRANGPGERAFHNGAEENVRLVLARTRKDAVQVDGPSLPALRNDAGDREPGAVLTVYRWKQQAVFGCHARTAFVLQDTAAQHLLDERAVIHQGRAGLARLRVERDLVPSFDNELAVLRKADVGDCRWRLEKSFSALAQPLHGAELDLRLSGLRDVRIRRVERPIGESGVRLREA